MITLQVVLIVVISLITLNLLFVGFYIVMVLREVKKTVSKASGVIDEVDKTVKDGIEKASAMQAPLQALAATTAALAGVVRGAEVIKRATNSILGGVSGSRNERDNVSTGVKKKPHRPRFFKKKSPSAG